MEIQESKFKEQTNVFYITSWGHCGDHWLSKALNAHPEIFVLNAHEGSRPKYFKDGLGRHERPDILQYTAFLEDMGTDYEAIGECHAYRASQMEPVQSKYGDAIPIVNLQRHPYVWLDFYIRHRASNVRMPDGSNDALDHEWEHSNHELFAEMGLMGYERDDVEIWSAYQGMLLLNQVLPDVESGVRQVKIESVLASREEFCGLVDYLSHGRCDFDARLLDVVYGFSGKVYRGEETEADPEEHFRHWPEWKRQAFLKLVSDDARAAYESFGYRVHDSI
ncbi:hypothetical protein QVG61_08775 [Thiohalobacter sp. IOR34]|uniref:hypothetical protein n=1 Tax=Thiohalobacter sp. IOR34 TaxID=3057176 RepID=UPI0025AF5E4D|nr:hypothetical protein [Thiohalobacter sp. IOR34]WJW74597.1 hypothetical protein QVG61_08775 [Thiohalobacter sp. IOR34]